MKTRTGKLLMILFPLAALGTYFFTPLLFSTSYDIRTYTAATSSAQTSDADLKGSAITDKVFAKATTTLEVTHFKTPTDVKAIYMSSWVAGTPSFRDKLVAIADQTEINAIVIDIKDYTGRVAFEIQDPELKKTGVEEKRVRDMREFIATLHEKGIYVIGRIAVFQDPYYVKLHPEYAVKRKSDGAVWKDRKGISWLDAGAKPVWEHIVAISKESYNAGFDELNFDYIRFPSDGNMTDIYYPHSQNRVKSEVLREFFSYLSTQLKSTGAILSADLFGLTTTAHDDLGIGQLLTIALPYFDYIAPMVYPSHYAAGFEGFSNPAAHPYEVIAASMKGAIAKIGNASTTAHFRGGVIAKNQIRPWLQDFDLGADYTADMVRAQIRATYDTGLSSWMLWDPNNIYTRGALLTN